MGLQGDKGFFAPFGQEGEDEIKGNVPCAQGLVIVQNTLVVVQMQVSDIGPEDGQPTLEVPAPVAVQVTHVQAELHIVQVDAPDGGC